MSDRGSLMRAILVDPACDTARLVLADWLEENGESERAEFVRVQCRLAYLESAEGGKHANHIEASKNCVLCYEVEQLHRREMQLWHGPIRPMFGYEIKSYWLGEASPDAEVLPLAIVRRGFVLAVRCTLADWVGTRCSSCNSDGTTSTDYDCGPCTGWINAHGPRIVAEQPVERVEVTNKRPWENSLNDGPVRFTWLTTELVDTRSAGNRDRLPPSIFELLHPLAAYRGIVQAGFNSEPAARSALSLALVNWARREAGLPSISSKAEIV